MATEDPLWAAIRRVRRRLGGSDQFPPSPPWEPSQQAGGSEIIQPGQSVDAPGPTVPTVTTTKEETTQFRALQTAHAVRGDWEERAAILEFEAQLDRATAERLALEEVRIVHGSGAG